MGSRRPSREARRASRPLASTRKRASTGRGPSPSTATPRRTPSAWVRTSWTSAPSGSRAPPVTAASRRAAAVAPAGPPPTTATSVRSGSTSGLDRHTRRRLRPRRSKAREPAPEAAERLADQERGDLASIDDGTESAPATARVDAPDGHRHEGSPGSRRAEEDLGLEHEALAAE